VEGATKLAVEIDGSIHSEDARIAQDRRRDAWLREQGLTVYRVSAGAVMRNSDEVAHGVVLLAYELLGRK
jgi:very-short-patch-repair endonuclease